MAREVTSSASGRAWTPARVFLAVSAAFHIPIAIVGLAYDRSFPIGAAAVERTPSYLIFGVLETNGWHTLGALIVGLVSLYFVLRPDGARAAALGLGVSHIFLWLALVLRDPSTFWIASNGGDQVIHATTAIGGTITGLMTRAHATVPAGA